MAVAMDKTSQLDADSDSDGLKDWEELLGKPTQAKRTPTATEQTTMKKYL